ncbi:hypothetical protein WG8_4851 [Paenibacillus sp. Aloe-11]|nr:hypothetical protein WG8_4851 [Paenibacillus sp. Aloe-11]
MKESLCDWPLDGCPNDIGLRVNMLLSVNIGGWNETV